MSCNFTESVHLFPKFLLVESYEILLYKIMSNAEIISFPIWVPFAALSCLMALEAIQPSAEQECRMSQPPLSRSWSQRKSFRPSVRGDDVSCRLVIDGLSYIEMRSLTQEFLSQMDVEFCQRLFLHYWDNCVIFFSFILFMWYIALFDLCRLDHPCIPGMTLIWSWCMILLVGGWIWIASILLRIFPSIFIGDIGL